MIKGILHRKYLIGTVPVERDCSSLKGLFQFKGTVPV